ncbi:BTAD domain-containing putative transcriptional regulator [Streptomyces sp. NPDC051162]|uniref:AfsR/SARP family transcriptional regulator n=1 Tax=Streptomyces sp. NPDC051162 TaxID=3154747 RepID=UPI0034245ABD
MIEISLLGSLRVRRDGVDTTPSAPKLRQVLTLLVLNANSLVSVDQLCEELWEDRPPFSALTTLQTYIYQLRRRLRLATGQSGTPFGSCPPRGLPALLTRVGGYELRLDEKQSVDAYRFEQLVERGQAEYRSGARDEAARTLQEALATWQGQALVDVAAGRRLSAWSTQLEERRKSALEQRFAIELELGRHQAVLDDLSAVFRSHPTHEAFADQLMRALHRSGRRPEALDVFRTLRARLVDELGLEPSALLQRLHQEVLTDGSHLAGPAKTKPGAVPAARTPLLGPAQLPADIGDFVGRAAALSQLEAYLGSRPGTAMRVVEVHGPPGVGKTAFAIRAAHRLRPHFPDGQLFIDLSEVGNGSAQLADVLTTSLSACGIRREKLPSGLDELSQLFRSWTADRRALVVVDDVLAASQLRALMPGGSGCAVIATNRYRAHSLSTGRKIVLSAFCESDALTLYNRVADERRREDEPEAVDELLRMCEGLPLVVRAVAGRLAARPGWSAARLTERLRGNPNLLLELPAGTQSLMSTVASSYRHLSRPHRQLLHLLIERRRPYWRIDEVTALVPRCAEDTETLMEYLVDVHLVQELPAPVGEPGPTADIGLIHSGPLSTGRVPAEPVYAVPGLTRKALLLLRDSPTAPGTVRLQKTGGSSLHPHLGIAR